MATTVATAYINVTCPAIPSLAKAFPEPLLLYHFDPVLNTPMRREGKTIVFVSHALNTVKELCQRTILLNEGRIVTMGDTEKVINDYLAIVEQK